MATPLTQDLIRFLDASPPAAALQWIAANLSREDQDKLRFLKASPPAQAMQWIAANIPSGGTAQPAAAPAGPPVNVNEAGYNQEKSDTNQQYGAQLAASDYANTIAQQRHARESGDWQIQANRDRQHFDSPWLRRGMFNSGLRQQGLADFRGDQARNYGAMQERQAGELGTIAMQRGQLLTQQQGALNAVDRARQQAIMDQLNKLGG